MCWVVALTACTTRSIETLPLAEDVDLTRFMGHWYVIAHVPTYLERNAWDASEHYSQGPDGSIETTFTYRDGSFAAERQSMTPRGFVEPGGDNAVWTMQFIWPFRADYRIAWLNADHAETIIARERRDYAWIMARQPVLTKARYCELVKKVVAMGYEEAELRHVPQPGSERGPVCEAFENTDARSERPR